MLMQLPENKVFIKRLICYLVILLETSSVILLHLRTVGDSYFHNIFAFTHVWNTHFKRYQQVVTHNHVT